jgi:lipoate-protein ligase A
MARDHALALALDPGSAVVRLYRWRSPTVSFGRNEPAVDVYDREDGLARGWSFVRRPTGGRAVLHHREVTYSVIFPARALGGPRAAYRAINRVLVRGLALLGVNVEIASDPPGRAPLPSAGPCFDVPEEGEVVAGGRKLVGSAQVRLGIAVLQHGSLLLNDDQTSLGEIRRAPPATRDTGSSPATLADLLGRVPGGDEVAEALARGFKAALPGAWFELRAGAVPGEAELLEHYRSERWTWRR